jgi:hypothetical protein
MNRIETTLVSSGSASEPYCSMAIDGVPIDQLLSESTDGLVSSLLGWFHNDADCEIPWDRILPEPGCTSYAPILICPDDLDLKCSVVVAEVVAERDIVRWDKLGFDATTRGAVGSIVRWEPSWGSYSFSRQEYEACIAAFKAAAAA